MRHVDDFLVAALLEQMISSLEADVADADSKRDVMALYKLSSQVRDHAQGGARLQLGLVSSVPL